MAYRIYTKTGDQGQTALLGGTRVSKHHERIEAYGTVDELNSVLGWVADLQDDADTITLLREIQERLFTIGSSLACDPARDTRIQLPDLRDSDLQRLEKVLDEMEASVPPLRSFILPGGHPAISAAHIARCVCRRAERQCVGLADTGAFVAPLVIPYLNRLSDYLFMLARVTAKRLGVAELRWEPRH